VSMKLPGIRLVPVEFEVGGQAPAEGAQAFQQLLPAGLARDRERSGVGDVDFDLVAFLQLKRLDHGGRQANGEAVAPFGDLHGNTLDIRF
jgi:hypothetical protein